MNVRCWGWLAVVLMLAFSVGCGGGGVAVQSPHTVPTTRPVSQTEQVILDVLPKRGWTAESVQPGRIVTFLAVRKHLLRAEIRYEANQVNIYYVDSDNLAAHVAADGRVYAHRSVNKWLMTLAQDIANALAAAPSYASPPPQ